MRLDQYFLESVNRWPQRMALELTNESLTYSQLFDQVERRRSALVRAGMEGKRSPVGVFTNKGVSAYASLLAVLSSGNIYTPLDVLQPPNRLQSIARTVKLAAVLFDEEMRGHAESLSCSCDPAPALVEAGCVSSPPMGAMTTGPTFAETDVDVAYILFTSGSSGTPKGIPVTHTSASTCIEGTAERFPIGAEDRVVQGSNLAFDLSIAELFLCWRAGACLCVPAETERAFPTSFIDRCQPTVWISVPTVVANLTSLGAVRPGRFPSIRLSLFCGEPLPTNLALGWQAATPSSQVVNLYGPTETAIFATTHVLDLDDSQEATVPIGTPLRGMRHRIVTQKDEHTAEYGAPGELLLAGPQVFDGYLANDTATAAAFERFEDDSSTRWYRTGDLVRARHDGVMIFCGRTNRELKIRGWRIDLLEVERVIREVCGADIVAVIPTGSGDGRYDDLVAFSNRVQAAPELLNRELRTRLPNYMIPSRLIQTDNFPLTASGKIDYVRMEQQLDAASHQETR